MAARPTLEPVCEGRALSGDPVTPIHQAALQYVTDHRLLLIPLEVGEKRPAYKTGENHATLATLNPDRINEWWTYRDFNIGLPCTPNRLAVIDVDGPAGAEHLNRLETEHGPLPTTWMQTSGRSDRPSYQYIYRWPGNQLIPTARISDQLEVRGHGAQVVVTPSKHPTGSIYHWLIPPADMPEGPAELPAWVLEELTRPPQRVSNLLQLPNLHGLADKRLEGLTQLVAQAGEGQRNIILNHAAYTAARIPGLTDQQISERLTTAAQTAGLEDREIQATIKSGIQAGHQDGPDPDHHEPGNWTLLIPRPNIAEAFREWAPVNLRPILTGQTDHLDPPPTILTRSDGINLLYRGELNWISGEPETGKSWLLQYAAIQQIINGESVLYVDLEDTPSRIIARLTGLGLTTDQITEQFHYVRPSTGADDADVEALLDLAGRCSLAVIDGTTDLHLIHGLDPEANKDAALIVARLLRPLANAGPAVVPVDHVTKNKETRGRYSIGAQHKLAAVRGAAYHLETQTPFGRGAHGHSRIVITKDRPGHIRGEHTYKSGKKDLAGDFYLDATSHPLEARLASPDEARNYRAVERQKNILVFVTEQVARGRDRPTKTTIEKLVGGRSELIRNDLDELVASGKLTMEKIGRGFYYAPGGTL